MTVAVYLAVYAAALVFVAACAARAWAYMRLPFNLRWELYPVPHEEPGRVEHGGSILEEGDWWTKKRHFSLLGELKFMIPEMLFLKALWEANRPLWFRSFPFHFGLYLMAGACGLVLAAAAADLAFPSLLGGPIGGALRAAYTAAGAGGLLLSLLGALALLQRRLADADLKPFTTAGDIFNLLFFVVALAATGAGYLLSDSSSHGVVSIARGLLTFDDSVRIHPMLASGLLLSALLVAYIPLTHMAHFIAKYFTYHHIRWGDEPNMKGGAIERRIALSLSQRPTWSAPHIVGDGTKTWVDVAIANPAREGDKK